MGAFDNLMQYSTLTHLTDVVRFGSLPAPSLQTVVCSLCKAVGQNGKDTWQCMRHLLSSDSGHAVHFSLFNVPLKIFGLVG